MRVALHQIIWQQAKMQMLGWTVAHGYERLLLLIYFHGWAVAGLMRPDVHELLWRGTVELFKELHVVHPAGPVLFVAAAATVGAKSRSELTLMMMLTSSGATATRATAMLFEIRDEWTVVHGSSREA